VNSVAAMQVATAGGRSRRASVRVAPRLLRGGLQPGKVVFVYCQEVRDTLPRRRWRGVSRRSALVVEALGDLAGARFDATGGRRGV